MDEVRTFIYEQIRKFRHDVGHAIHWKGIFFAAQLQSPHIKNNWQRVAEDMINEGLIERNESGEFLTQKGSDEIWGRS